VFGAGAAVAIPVAIYLAILWLLHVAFQESHHGQKYLLPTVIVLVLLTTFSNGQAPLLIGIILVALLAFKLYGRYKSGMK
jgi:hypothetical protein